MGTKSEQIKRTMSNQVLKEQTNKEVLYTATGGRIPTLKPTPDSIIVDIQVMPETTKSGIIVSAQKDNKAKMFKLSNGMTFEVDWFIGVIVAIGSNVGEEYGKVGDLIYAPNHGGYAIYDEYELSQPYWIIPKQIVIASMPSDCVIIQKVPQSIEDRPKNLDRNNNIII